MTVFSIVMLILFLIIFVLAMWKGREFLKLPLKWKLSIALGFGALMMTWIVLGHREADKHENTVMEICFREMGGVAYGVYPKGLDVKADCSPTELFSWPGGAKAVYLDDPHGIQAAYGQSLQGAIDYWNNQLGRDVLRKVNSAPEADIVVRFGAVAGAQSGEAKHTRADGVLKAQIVMTRPTDIGTMMWLMAHELGHARFGLAHDANGSIMDEVVKSDRIYLVSEPDKEAILKMLDGK